MRGDELLMATRNHAAEQRGIRRTWRWRGAYVVVLVAAVGALVAGVAYAALTANGSGTGSASTGSVALSVNASATNTCTYSALTPGSLTGSTTCALSVTYTGSISAYVSLTVRIQSKAGSGVGAHTLYDPTTGNGTDLLDQRRPQLLHRPDGAGTTGPATAPAGSTCWTSDDELAAWYSGSTPNLTFANGDSAVTWTVTPLFPTSAGNAYQGATASLTLTAQAVQAPANPLPAECTTSTIGQSCPASGSFAWS